MNPRAPQDLEPGEVEEHDQSQRYDVISETYGRDDTADARCEGQSRADRERDCEIGRSASRRARQTDTSRARRQHDTYRRGDSADTRYEGRGRDGRDSNRTSERRRSRSSHRRDTSRAPPYRRDSVRTESRPRTPIRGYRGEQQDYSRKSRRFSGPSDRHYEPPGTPRRGESPAGRRRSSASMERRDRYRPNNNRDIERSHRRKYRHEMDSYRPGENTAEKRRRRPEGDSYRPDEGAADVPDAKRIAADQDRTGAASGEAEMADLKDGLRRGYTGCQDLSKDLESLISECTVDEELRRKLEVLRESVISLAEDLHID
ncbi:uncharacterized protein BDZ99DRAFT_166798 [Mytilinidion resinicola]|uniref:Uncharacterized protein n=1 Tax=Mytilinidion resinicola TaxID=574789 RepID=A0A6A6Y5Q1_9PEZI|nr:uncharacterized protein BDZ99DRAFT_166798 [Mytilinidion resinicola]KAF2803555.1 hypothetical protein BDZ99DRAFT_166798 [Mytilinidion resinicola]